MPALTRTPYRPRLALIIFACGLSSLFAAASAAPPPASCQYDSQSRTLLVTTAAGRHFRYDFNPGGAIARVYDLDLDPSANLVGDTYQGESTDRVIQWTYWNGRYLAQPHHSGDGDRRANVTMEGCYHGAHACQVLATPDSASTSSPVPSLALTFRSRITHWFYSELDRHGRPDFVTTSRYQPLPDGSLKLTRSILRRPWPLRDIVEKTWQGGHWSEARVADTNLTATHISPGSITSYLESWTPLRRSTLPRIRHGGGGFDKAGYHFWSPRHLGGWVMAYGESVALAVVFGLGREDIAGNHPRLAFNRQDLPEHNLNVLLPAIETDWPDHTTLTQTLIFVVGAPDDVATRASALVPQVAAPSLAKHRSAVQE